MPPHLLDQAFDDLLLGNTYRWGVIDRSEGGDHAEERNPHHGGAGPEMPRSLASVMNELR